MESKRSLAHQIYKAFTKKKKTLALAESCTGGLVSNKLTDISGSSKYFKGGVVAYSNDIKIKTLGVSKRLIKKHGAVSPEVSKSMARGVRRVFKADVAASITGIAGPTGGTKAKPVGLAYISIASSKGVKTKRVLYKGTRKTIKRKFAKALLKDIYEF